MIPRQTVKYNQRIFDTVVKHMPFRTLLILLSILLNQQHQYLPLVKAYAITKPSIAFVPQQYVRLVDETNQQQQQLQLQQQQQSTHKKKVKYDLGIQQSNEINLNIDEVTQYLVEHESVNDYPSPILLAQHEPTKSNEYPEKSIPVAETTVTTTTTTATTSTNTKKRKQHPPLIPNRLTDDSVLKIVQNRHHHHHRPQHQSLSSSTSPSHTITQAIVHPQMINGHDFDINTAWIELLIHEQQMKLMTSTTTTAAAVTA